MTIKVLSVFGTRAEAIKMAPLVKKLAENPAIDSKVCVTAQHRHMLDQVLEIFSIKPDYDLDIMQKNQTLAYITSEALQDVTKILEQLKPDCVLVHGDTTTTMAAALAAFYLQIPVGHVEAGLRTHNRLQPFPEEINRLFADNLCDMHFAPTQSAAQNLSEERIPDKCISVTGNTVIDALLETKDYLQTNKSISDELAQKFNYIDESKKLIVVTGHRRESFGLEFEHICEALLELSKRKDVQIIYPVHLNPNVQEPVNRMLASQDNIYLIEPQDYLSFVYLMQKAHIILTDSGGLQEESPALDIPLLVMRKVTERPEAIDSGTAKLVGTEVGKIVATAQELLDNSELYKQMSEAKNPFGDGKASGRIVAKIVEFFQ